METCGSRGGWEKPRRQFPVEATRRPQTPKRLLGLGSRQARTIDQTSIDPRFVDFVAPTRSPSVVS